MRLGIVLLLVLAAYGPTASATCSSSDSPLGADPNTVTVSSYNCDGPSQMSSHTIGVRTFSPFTTSNSAPLITVTTFSKVDHGAFQTYQRTDRVTINTAGLPTDATLSTSHDDANQTSCRLSLTLLGIAAARNAPMPACASSDTAML